MSHLISLAKLARLVGLTRASLQAMIRHGELDTFDGMVRFEEVLRAFPDARLDDDTEFRRVEEIKEQAFGKRVRERALPEAEVLAERLYELGKEFAAVRERLARHEAALAGLLERLQALPDTGARATVDALIGWTRATLAGEAPQAPRARQLLAEESVMRVMSAQVTVLPSRHEFFVEGNDTLLEAALRSGLSLSYGCSNGNCGDCKARVVSGQVTKVRPHDFRLTEAERAAGAILLCAYTAVGDVVLETGVASAQDIPEQTVKAKVRALEPLGADIMALHLLTPRSQRLRFLAGQSVLLEAGEARAAFAVASCPCEERRIEVHVRRDEANAFARLVFGGLKANADVTIIGPQGRFVLDDGSTRPLLLIAEGAGFPPVKSLLQHAMSLEQAESVALYWFAPPGGHYQESLQRAYADALEHFRYFPVVAESGPAPGLADLVARHGDLAGFDAYAAGSPAFVEAAREHLTAAGLPASAWRELAVD